METSKDRVLRKLGLEKYARWDRKDYNDCSACLRWVMHTEIEHNQAVERNRRSSY